MSRVLLLVVLFGGWVGARTDDVCTLVTKLSALPGVAEASGVAVSRRTPGLIWSHNDSGDPILFAFDASGAPRGRVAVTGAEVRDWEDVAVGPCPDGSCVYIADIGDNNRSRREVTIYRITEPRADEKASRPAERWTAVYPDGAHDAEAVFIIPPGEVFIVSKDGPGATSLYRMPASGRADRVARMNLIARLPLDRVTGAGASPDGTWVALRTNSELLFYRTRDLTTGARAQPTRVDLRAVGEPQGEGVALGANGIVYLVGEGGGRGGTLATLRCTLR